MLFRSADRGTGCPAGERPPCLGLVLVCMRRDTVIGRNVNVGAGTITCNYDGINKFVTTIEDGVFIGSNSALVAPVTIGAQATIGAGSVITKDAPAGELSVARARQATLPGWKRPTKKT